MTVAGSDSAAGAGIQADLKTFAAHECYGCSVITATTAQNTVGVTDIFELPLSHIEAQFDAVATDLPPVAIKTGMLASVAVVELVVRKVTEYGLKTLIVDPVMVAASGDVLVHKDTVDAITRNLIPLAKVVTPNLHEATILTNSDVRTVEDMRNAAKAIYEMGPKCVVVKGGHLKEEMAIDIMLDENGFTTLYATRVATHNTHGSGCTFASAITAELARGKELKTAVINAKSYISRTIENTFSVGNGNGPVNHFVHWWGKTALSRDNA